MINFNSFKTLKQARVPSTRALSTLIRPSNNPSHSSSQAISPAVSSKPARSPTAPLFDRTITTTGRKLLASIAATTTTSSSTPSPAMAATKLNADTLFELMKVRHSYYPLSKDLPISQKRIREIVEKAMVLTPSSFNNQSNRVVVLFDSEHDRFWDMATDALKAIVPEEKWEPTGNKMKMFKGAAGTIMFFEDQEVVDQYAANIPTYADKFGTWATQSDGMLQFVLWVALENEGLGANLQHYNPVVDDGVRAAWKIPPTWTLNAQLVFGGRDGELELKDQVPIDKRVKVYSS